MGGYLGSRLLQAALAVLSMASILFVLLRLLPGDPALVILGARATPAALAQVRANIGLDRSLPEQYLRFVGGLLQGEFGDSLQYRRPVDGLILERLPPTLSLVVCAALMTVLLSLPLAAIAAARLDSWLDYILRGTQVLVFAMPPFWLALMLIQVVSLNLRWLPVSGWGDSAGDHVRHVLLPSLTVALPFSALISRSLRASILEQAHSDHVRTARAKGLALRAVVLRHILRLALIPAATIFGLQLGVLVGGTVIIESIFAIPGLGQLLITAVSARDYPVVQGVVLLVTLLVTLITLTTDLVAFALDPRGRRGA